MKLNELLNNIELDNETIIELCRALLLKAVPDKVNVINACINSIKNTPNSSSPQVQAKQPFSQSPSFEQKPSKPSNPVSNNPSSGPNPPSDKQMYRIKKIEEETGHKFTGTTKSDAFKFISAHS